MLDAGDRYAQVSALYVPHIRCEGAGKPVLYIKTLNYPDRYACLAFRNRFFTTTTDDNLSYMDDDAISVA